jgi:hypothetical protein
MTMRQARADLTAAALTSLATAAVALAIRVLEPFDHGTWLVAYLVLVGFLAQLLLGRGQAGLVAGGGLPPPPRGVRLAQALLWNFGVITVPVGVLAETRLAVMVGSVSLLVALASLWETARPALPGSDARPTRRGWAYALLLLAMTASTIVGTALAWDIPWA